MSSEEVLRYKFEATCIYMMTIECTTFKATEYILQKLSITFYETNLGNIFECKPLAILLTFLE